MYSGLGIMNLIWKNEVLGAKHIWHLYAEREKKWAKILYNKYLIVEDPNSILRMKTLLKGSESWNFMVKCHYLVRKYLTWDVSKREMLFLGRFMA